MTVDEYKEKITRVEEDIQLLRSTGDSSRKLEALIEYKEYLEDELRLLKREGNA